MSKKTTVQTVSLAVLMLVCGTLWYRNANSSAGASDADVKPGGAYRPMSVENPRIHWDHLNDPAAEEFKAPGRDIFNWRLPPPPPPPPPLQVAAPPEDYVPPPPPPPPPPKLPLKFFGLGTDTKGTARRAFLSDTSDVFIVAEGETVLGRYRILRITNTSLDFEEISSGRRASTPLEQETPGN
jgi:hypothetical protein